MSPAISCICLTYGRVALLEEALYSFITQDYEGERELIIVNDYPKQNLKFDHPFVNRINREIPFDTWGEKINYAIGLSKHPIIAIWDDDDVALSNHLKNIADHFIDCDLMHWQRGGFVNSKRLDAITHLGNSGIVFSKDIWNHVGGYPQIDHGSDMGYTQKITHEYKGRIKHATPLFPSWLYMWGDRTFHISGVSENKDRVIETYRAYIEQEVEKGKIPLGDIELNPNWSIDYQNLVTSFLEKDDTN
jgi:glycosyltransferase involved in cell wall biosynthesis